MSQLVSARNLMLKQRHGSENGIETRLFWRKVDTTENMVWFCFRMASRFDKKMEFTQYWKEQTRESKKQYGDSKETLLATETSICETTLRGSTEWLFETENGNVIFKEAVVWNWKGTELVRTRKMEELEECVLNDLVRPSRRKSSVQQISKDRWDGPIEARIKYDVKDNAEATYNGNQNGPKEISRVF